MPAASAETVAARLGLEVYHPPPPLVTIRCVRCRRPYMTTVARVTVPCPFCYVVEPGLTFGDLLLMIEFGLSRKAYFARLEKYGPPWVSPKEWITPRRKWPKLRPPPDTGNDG